MRRRLLLSLVVGVVLLSACGSEDDSESGGTTVRSTTLQQVLRDPAVWVEREVMLRGWAYPRRGGFLLADDGSSIWVAAPHGMEEIEAADRVVVRGEVQRLSEERSDDVVQALRGPTEPGLPKPDADVVQDTPARAGEPFVVFRALVWQGDSSRPPGGETTSGDADDGDVIDDLASMEERLERRLRLVRTGGGSDLEEETGEPVVAAARYEIAPSSREFELLIFPSHAAAQRALDDFSGEELVDQEWEFAVAANVVAAFPAPTGGFRGYERVRDVLDDLE